MFALFDGATISIHALRGEGDQGKRIFYLSYQISIHALRGEGDKVHKYLKKARQNFNPRPPWGGRRKISEYHIKRYRISIHALRGEGDKKGRKVYNLDN